jgi:hypothetical protein
VLGMNWGRAHGRNARCARPCFCTCRQTKRSCRAGRRPSRQSQRPSAWESRPRYGPRQPAWTRPRKAILEALRIVDSDSDRS